jgi:hypothetical protein
MTIADVLRYAVETVSGDTLEMFYTKNAFDRRDLLKSLAPEIIKRLPKIIVVARASMDPDEKAMLAAISPYSDVEITARA